MTVHECVAEAMDNGLGSALESLEEKRLQMKRGNGRIMFGGAGLTLLLMGWLVSIQSSAFGYVFVAAVAVIICALWIRSRNSSMACQFKDEAIPLLLDAALPGFRYRGANCVGEDEFDACGLFRSPDRYNGKDYFEGVHGRTALHFSLVHAEERYETTTTETDSDGHTTTRTEEHWRDIFKGLFFSADFNKEFHGRTLVRAGKAGLFSGLFGNLVKLEDPRFSSRFRVYSSDQVEARYILTPRLMERLLELESSLGGFEASFIGSWVYIAAGGFPYNAFEPDVGRPFTDPAQVTKTLGWIFHVVGIVEELDLNTRIWSKR